MDSLDMLESALGLVLVVVVLALAAFIFFLITLQNALKAVRPENRKMRPGQVWLLLIPLFSLVWQFMVVDRVADSLANEYRSRGITPGEQRPGYSVGLAFCILGICSFIPLIGTLASLGSIVCWIIYWVKIANYKNALGTVTGALDENI